MKLYARFVLWLIQPALDLHKKRTEQQREHEADETMLRFIVSDQSMVATGLESVYGLKRKGR